MLTIQENISLSDHTTFKLGGVARYFIEIESEDELVEAYLFAHEKNLPVFILGGGSNTIFTEKGFEGLVIKIVSDGIYPTKEDDKEVHVEVQAGEEWDAFVAHTLAHHWYGLENLSFVPGTVGGAPVQNIGAYGVEVASYVESVRAFDTQEKKFVSLSKEDCHFAYRNSLFKEEKNRYVIVSVVFVLSKTFSPHIEYAGIVEGLEGKEVTGESVREAVIALRTRKLPNWKTLPTAGSFFKNPEVAKEVADALKEKFPDLPVYPSGSLFKLSAGYLIEHVAGLKGYKMGGVGVFEKHALVLVNYGEGTYGELESLIATIQNKVQELTGVLLEPEVNIIR